MSKTLLGLRMRRRYSLKGSHIMGMAVAEDALFAVDSWSRQIQRRRLDDQLSLERAWPSPGPNPSALCFDGKYLWSVDKDRRLLYQHALDERLTVLNSYPLEHAPIGISLRKGCFWTVDERARTFYLLRATQQTQAGAFGLAELDGVSAPLSSFSWRGDSLWIGFDGLARLIERPKRRLGRR
ncbi:MAG: hypothetical protein HY748_01125 [Elusimicrobia bacterium]|nr:hypothetical protein [Elusimicrobiota bacterium]